MMHIDNKLVQQKLLASGLIAALDGRQTNEFRASHSPLTWLIVRDLVKKPQTFYQDVAALLGVRYAETLPVAINNANSLAYTLGSQTVSELRSFPYVQDTKVVVACWEPSDFEKVVETCQARHLEYEDYELVIAAPNVVRAATAGSNYRQSEASAEQYLSTSNPPYSSRAVLTVATRIVIALLTIAVFALFVWQPPLGMMIFFIAINGLYLVLNPVRMIIAFAPALPRGKLAAPLKVPVRSYPTYTILVPLKSEAPIIPKLMARLRQLDYPAEKLDIKLIAEVTDHATLEALAKEGIDERATNATRDNSVFHLVKVPVGPLSTKPRSCNYALQFARGMLTVIYDAEDWPDTQQLKLAYNQFLQERLNTICIQAKLGFYNERQNILTRLFTLEYGFWYEFLLPGLQRQHIPLPLGGTSNHFLTATLRKIGTWDPYNTTEDADLGWRLARLGYRTYVLNSYTLEEANAHFWSWIRQRTRWQKGFLLTVIVHLRTPFALWRQLGPWGSLSSALFFATNFWLPVVNPLLWGLFAFWYVPPLFGLPPIGFQLPDWAHTVGVINLILGNGTFILAYVVVALKRRDLGLLPAVLLMPIYWLMMSYASYRAIYQIIFMPYKWEKTEHGTPIGPVM